MQKSERQIAVVKDISIVGFFSVANYDFYITDKRMVLIHTKSTKQWGAAIGAIALGMGVGIGSIVMRMDTTSCAIAAAFGGMVGMIVGSVVQGMMKSREKQKEQNFEGELALDGLLKRDNKSFDIPYQDVEHIRLYKLIRARHLDVKSKKIQKTFGLTTTQFNQLSSVFSSIDDLKGKIEK